MEQNKESDIGYLEKLAILSDAVDELHKGKKAIVFDLESEEFLKVRGLLNNVPEDKEQFKIDISGIEFIYLLSK